MVAASSREAISARSRVDYCRLTDSRSSLWRRLYAGLAYGFAGMRGDTVEFRILGPLEVVAGERRVAVGGARTRAVLALLLMNANRVVPADVLIRELWPDLAPDRAAANLQVRLSELRKALRTVAQGDRLQTRPPGYSLRVASDELDVLRFEQLVAASRGALASGDADAAVRLLDQSLALWRAWRWLTSTMPSSPAWNRRGSRRNASARSSRGSTRCWRAAGTRTQSPSLRR